MIMNDAFAYLQRENKVISKVIKDNAIPQKFITILERSFDERREKCVKIEINAFISKIRFVCGFKMLTNGEINLNQWMKMSKKRKINLNQWMKMMKGHNDPS
jgi:hypothetical protein